MVSIMCIKIYCVTLCSVVQHYKKTIITKHLFNLLIDIHDEQKLEFLENLRQSRLISVMIDGATDSSNSEDEIVYVKYVNHELSPVQCFLGIQGVEHAHADGVLAAVDTGL